MIVVGADVWRRGWVAVRLSDDGTVDVRSFESLTRLGEASPAASVIGVDIPIGLPDPPPRRADALARERLGPRRSSVFPAIPARVLEAETYQQALTRCRELYGVGLSAQAFALRHRTVEAARTREHDPRLHEVHPELSFAEMGGRPMSHPKRSWNGQMQRLAILAEHGIVLPDRLAGSAASVPVDDVLDAAAAAWSARRIGRGEATMLPPDPEPSDGTIWC
jgi:predicted RNase H-like nuclease